MCHYYVICYYCIAIIVPLVLCLDNSINFNYFIEPVSFYTAVSVTNMPGIAFVLLDITQKITYFPAVKSYHARSLSSNTTNETVLIEIDGFSVNATEIEDTVFFGRNYRLQMAFFDYNDPLPPYSTKVKGVIGLALTYEKEIYSFTHQLKDQGIINNNVIGFDRQTPFFGICYLGLIPMHVVINKQHAF